MSDSARPKVGGDKLSNEEVNADLPIILNGGETITGDTLPVAAFVLAADGELYACDADDDTKLDFSGFVISDTTDGNPATFQKDGVVAGFTGLTINALYYVQDDKTIGLLAGTNKVLVGRAISATQILILKETNRVAAGVMPPLATKEIATTDEVIVCGFAPKIIVLNYFVQGHDPSTAWAVFTGEKGMAVFNGTTMVFKVPLWVAVSGSGTGMTGDNGVPSNIPLSYGTLVGNDPTGAGAISSGVEHATNTADIKIVLTINSVEADGFTIRMVTTTLNGTSDNFARAKVSWVAYE